MEEKKEAGIKIEPVMISTNPSTHRGIMDYSDKSELLAFASGSLAYISSIPSAMIFCSLRGHAQAITCLKWVGQPLETPQVYNLFTSSSDSSLNHWKCRGDPKDYKNWMLQQSYQKIHKAPIELLSTLSKKEETYLLSYSIDGTLIYWKNNGAEFKELQIICTLQFGKALLETISIYPLNEKTNIIALGGFTNSIHIYAHSVGLPQLDFKCSLLGHQNSIRDLSFAQLGSKDILLASGSMDGSIRLWRIRELKQEIMQEEVIAFEEEEESTEVQEQYKSKMSYVFEGITKGEYYNIVLESVLSYHSEGISSIQWGMQKGKEKVAPITPADLCLISAANDGSICLWEIGKESGSVWTVTSSFGEFIAGSRNAVYGASFCNKQFTDIIAYTYNGCFLRWVWNAAGLKWEPGIVITGHYNSVKDVLWDPSEQFLLSCSADMQTKIFGRWNCSKEEAKKSQWHEISRPQIHGYEINSIVACPNFPLEKDSPHTSAPFKIISAAEEKVLRVFDPPFIFLKAANDFSGANIKYIKDLSNAEYEGKVGKAASSAAGGSITQPLTLMNKPIPVGPEGEEEMNPYSFNPENFLSNKVDIPAAEHWKGTFLEKNEPPQEHFLSNFGLWPESQKMYGHSYEIQTLAITHNGKYIASSANANKSKDAYIIIWDSQSMKQVSMLLGHLLSVAQMEFSNDDSRLLSVGRDRQWIMYGDSTSLYGNIIKKMPEAHAKSIYSCSWAEDDAMFVTSAREKKNSVKFWIKGKASPEEWVLDSVISELANVNAVKFFPATLGKRRVLAGNAEGNLTIWEKTGSAWNRLSIVDSNLAHGDIIHRISFNKDYSKKNPKKWLIASGSSDRSVRILRISE